LERLRNDGGSPVAQKRGECGGGEADVEPEQDGGELPARGSHPTETGRKKGPCSTEATSRKTAGRRWWGAGEMAQGGFQVNRVRQGRPEVRAPVKMLGCTGGGW